METFCEQVQLDYRKRLAATTLFLNIKHIFFSRHVPVPEIFFLSQAAHMYVVFPSYILPAIIAR